MAIKDLKAREGKVDIIAEVVDKADVKEFSKFGKAGRVCNAKVKDESGEMTLTLWNEDIDKVNVGDKIHISNGYVSEWQGELQLSTGRFGKLEVVEAGKGEIKKEKPAVKEDKKESFEKVKKEMREEFEKLDEEEVKEEFIDDISEENIEE
jgi:replication factor A1